MKKPLGRLPDDLISHSDQGSQYTGYEYVNEVLKNNIALSYSAPGAPTENPGQESFFGRLKDECKSEFLEMETFEELKKLISKSFKFMNKKKISLSYLTKNISIVIGLVLVWRGIWHMLDELDRLIFGGSHLWTSLFGVIIGLIILYLPDKDLKEIKKL